MRADQAGGCGDQIRVVPCLCTVREKRDVFQPGADTMASLQPTPIDCPARHAVSVVNLWQGDARGHHIIFHACSVTDSRPGVGVKRLDKDAATPVRQSRTHEGARIGERQQSSLNTDAAGQ